MEVIFKKEIILKKKEDSERGGVRKVIVKVQYEVFDVGVLVAA